MNVCQNETDNGDEEKKRAKKTGKPASPEDPRAKSMRDADVQEYVKLVVETADMLSDADAGKLLGVAKSTVWRWKQLEGFKQAVQKEISRKHIPRFPPILEAIEKKAQTGDVRAAEFVRDTIGLQPAVQVSPADLMALLPMVLLERFAAGALIPQNTSGKAQGKANVIDAEVLEDTEEGG